MAPRYCEVALPVPLRSTFTYAVPDSFDGEPLVGRRVVVPFRRRAMVGVALAELDSAPDFANSKSSGKPAIKEIAEVMDSVPALPPKLVELGHWISRYYLAPIGETFAPCCRRKIEVRHDREYSLTDAGRAYVSELQSTAEITDSERKELALLSHFAEKDSSAPSARVRRLPGGEAAAGKLVRRAYLTARDVVRRRKTRTQTIVAGANPQRKLPPAIPSNGFAKCSRQRAARCRWEYCWKKPAPRVPLSGGSKKRTYCKRGKSR